MREQNIIYPILAMAGISSDFPLLLITFSGVASTCTRGSVGAACMCFSAMVIIRLIVKLDTRIFHKLLIHGTPTDLLKAKSNTFRSMQMFCNKRSTFPSFRSHLGHTGEAKRYLPNFSILLVFSTRVLLTMLHPSPAVLIHINHIRSAEGVPATGSSGLKSYLSILIQPEVSDVRDL